MSRLRETARALLKSVSKSLTSPTEANSMLSAKDSSNLGARFCERFQEAQKNGYHPAPNSNPLREYFEAHKVGPGVWKWEHYFDIYHRHFQRFVGREVHLMEIGIYSGGSLPMWHHYFGPRCHVYGVDIEKDCLVYNSERTRVIIGDQSDRSFWAKVRADVPIVDILIDDGGHTPEQQRITVEEMLPHLRPGGVYVCEDIHGSANLFAAYVHGLANQLNAANPSELPAGVSGFAFAPVPFQRAIESINLYPFVTVIEKRATALTSLVAPKHGTAWQPFLSHLGR